MTKSSHEKKLSESARYPLCVKMIIIIIIIIIVIIII